MLRYNFNTSSGLCARQWGTTLGLQRYFYSRSELRNYTASEGFDNNKAGIPNGHLDPSSWILPQSSGGISAYEDLRMITSTAVQLGQPEQMEGSITMTTSGSATLKGIGLLSGSVTPFTELSPRNLAEAVWTADKNDYTAEGTMGKQLNSVKINTDLIPAVV